MPTPAVRVLPSIKGLSPFGDEEIHVSHLPPEEQQLLRKVETAAKGAIRETELPSLPNILTVDGNEPIEVSAVPANAEAVQAAAGATGVVPGPMPTSLEPVLKMMSPETLEEISTSLKEGLDRLHGAEDELGEVQSHAAGSEGHAHCWASHSF